MLARVFPRRTNASPNDPLAFFGPPGMFLPEITEVHISVTFTWDIPKAERLARQWETVAPVKIGGPALGDPGNGFMPGQYLKQGYVITSRGCPNRCWFCDVWKREGDIRELPIKDGFNVLDSNLLACSQDHQEQVFEMLLRQKEKARFTGGLEAKRLTEWHVEWLSRLKAEYVWMAYDTPEDYEPLKEASSIFKAHDYHGLRSRWVRVYVLCGWDGDTMQDAEKRLRQVIDLGLVPMAMLYNRGIGRKDMMEWRRFQRKWTRVQLMLGAIKGG